MKLLQISPTMGEYCGIALFAERLAAELEGLGIGVMTVAELNDEVDVDIDVVLIQHHEDLLDDGEVEAVCSRVERPVVLFAHSTGIERVINIVDGVLAMSPGMIPDTDTPVLVFPHPARVPRQLTERNELRDRFDLPLHAKIIGTCGFLKFERQLIEILSVLLPYTAESGWFVQTITSPWYIDSPGLVEGLGTIRKRYPDHLSHEHKHFSEEELNLRLQACDLLWCWTRAQSSPYASGVASDLYASGSRIVAADKMQHDHILRLPNVVRAPASLDTFVEALVCQAKLSSGERHDPSPVSWTKNTRTVGRFLHEVAASRRRPTSSDTGAGRRVTRADEE